MIYKQYGEKYQSVDTNFDAKAMTEVGFRRNRTDSFEVSELGQRFEKYDTVELTAEAEGAVQTETEQGMLDTLSGKIDEVMSAMPEGAIAVVENESGHDYPKPRQEIKNVIEEGENKLHFHYSMSPALRFGLYRPKD